MPATENDKWRFLFRREAVFSKRLHQENFLGFHLVQMTARKIAY